MIKQRNLLLLGVLMIVLVGLSNVRARQQAVQPAIGDGDRLAALENGLAQDEKRIDALEADVALLKAAPAHDGATPTPGQPTNVPGINAGSRWKGGFSDRTTKHTALDAVTTISEGGKLWIKITTEVGPYEWRFVTNGDKLQLVELLPLKAGGAQFSDIKVGGTLKNGELNVSGTWRWQGRAGGGGGTQMSMHLSSTDK